MLKEAIERLLQAGQDQVLAEKKHEIIAIGNEHYAYNLPQKIKERPFETIQMGTLDGIIDYIKSGADAAQMGATLICHVVSEKCVKVLSEYNTDREHHCYVNADALVPPVILNRFMGMEEMVISLQALFVNTKGRDIVLTALSNFKKTDSVALADDGISQKITVEKGDELFDRMTIQNPVYLKPFRTFIEVEQPESPFILRINEGQAALFEADGGRWRIVARTAVGEYLSAALRDHPNVKVLL